MSTTELWQKLRDPFRRRGFVDTRRDNIAPLGMDTLFVIAGLQVLASTIMSGEPPPPPPFVIAQPVVRMRHRRDVGATGGFSSAFVNVCTEEIVLNEERLRDHLQTWLDAFSDVGLHARYLTLVAERLPFNGGPYVGRYLIVNWAGIELGDIVLIHEIRQQKWVGWKILDFGFGLERILWAVNGVDTYYDSIGTFHGRLRRANRLTDAVRTATLLTMSGVEPGHRGQGYRLRLLVKEMVSGLAGYDLRPFVGHAYSEWSSFIRPRRNQDAVLSVLEREMRRRVNLDLCAACGIAPPKRALDGDLDSFCDALLRDGLSLDRLLSAGAMKDVGSCGGA